ncbi:gamma-glutamyl-gamma-aminobutyrate hydrolase [Siccirubricoccus deserti]|uniref:Gamma-glutamyl-gamma-aminobutyrate hydrolase family protein n=1 Tax=Siccirubricoccus deserti TaxID=2013562 RepID=A0A9X0UHE5_9PROT|nr:gamma-glutamyl-gamma-aminobutyrate hydrolase family protein [Siccirubricoccus deserti]MBC4016135.1 gamma-glutamyl-gamma-aminobutyrate hydrolase family protein [Siccirubricoccus deserti]GGC45767.1 gamma-glutamyl-gamma-aminobutyrate hydrolase [Siccirubricoccus deserti]
MRTRPIIGVTLDAEEPGGYSKLPWYALRKNYFSSLAEAGALPMALPHQTELAEAYLDTLDGLLITGGAFDVDPSLYGGGPAHPTVTLKAGRTDFELAVTRGALARNLPVLGICGGQQLLAVALGGTLIQHIPDTVAEALEHEQPNPRDQPGHEIAIAANTLLASIVGKTRMAVNSAHHQAVATPGEGAVVNAVAPDGVVEGVEHAGYRFALGVQWHPEYAVDPADPLIFQAFVQACRG